MQIDGETDAWAFEATWGGWLRDQYLADLQADAETCRERAETTFNRFINAAPESAVDAAYDLLVAYRLLRRAVGAVVRFDAFITPPGWYRVDAPHTEYFTVHYDVVPPNRDQHRKLKLGLNQIADEREPLSLRTRPRDVRIGIWRRLYVRDRVFSVERTLTATKQAFTNAGGYVAVYRPKADYAFLFERHIPDGIEFLPHEVTDWLNRHAPGWRFIDRRRHVGRNTVWQDTLIVFEGREDAEAFRTQWASFLHSGEEAGLQRELARAEERLHCEIIGCKTAEPHRRSKQVEVVLDAERSRYGLARLLAFRFRSA